jgi:photosystem I subunit 2
MFSLSATQARVVGTTPRATTRRAPSSRGTHLVVRAEEKAAAAPAAAPAPWTAPKLNPNTPSPIFGGSTGGLLRKAQVEEFYVLTWEAKKEAIFEMPTGGAAIMRKGPNLLKLARKEQCLALLNNFRAKMKLDGCIYRVFPSGEVQYLHPKDGVYPEKVNKGRVGANQNMRSIGKNTNPATIKFSGKVGTFDA